MSVASDVEAAHTVSLPESPYVGLVPYDEADAAFFFGRSTEVAIVAANLRSVRLTILYGPSGVGKTSLLMAGVVHSLREEARAVATETPFAVCVYRSWRDDPVRGLQEAARAALQEAAGDEAISPPAAALADSLRAWTDRAGTLLVVLDQFEEYFQYHPDEGGDERLTGFAAELTRIVNDPNLPVRVLLSIREDALAKLDRFEGHIPSLFSNYLRVDHLDLDAAREAIEGPIDAWNRALPPGSEPYSIEPALTEAVLKAAAGGGLTLAAGSEIPAVEAAPDDRVEAPFLQLVLERLWRETVAGNAHTLTLARLEALGGARRIVENHLLDALARLTPAEQDVASDCFRFLVSSDKTKIAHPAADLSDWTQRPEQQVTAVLDKLCSGESGRILRAVAPARDEGSTSYELFHDILAEPILAWRATHEAERSRQAARRRRVRITGIVLVLVLLPIFAALSGWAWFERNNAQDRERQAQNAQKKALRSLQVADSFLLASASQEQALINVPSNLNLALLLALGANLLGTDPQTNAQARSAMTLALEARATQSDTIIRRAPAQRILSIAFSPDGQTLAAAIRSGPRNGTVRRWGVAPRKPLGAFPIGTIGRAGVVFSRDGRVLATAGDDGTVRLWDVSTGTSLGTLISCTPDPGTPLVHPVESVALGPDGRTLATSCGDGKVQLWRVATPKPLGAFPISTIGRTVVVFSRDGRVLATGGDDGVVRLWDVSTRTLIGTALSCPPDLQTGRPPPIESIGFSPDGHTLASSCGDGIQLWGLPPRRPPVIGSTDSAVRVVEFSPDGRTLATGEADGTVRLWDGLTGTPLGDPLNPGLTFQNPSPVETIAFSPDGLTLATSDQMTAQLWEGVLWSTPTNLHKLVCRFVSGSLTGNAKQLNVQLPRGLAVDPSCA